MQQFQLRLLERHYEDLRKHLLPGDGKEAVAVILCGRHEDAGRSILLGHELMLIPHAECERDRNFIKWKTTRVVPFFERVEKDNFAIVKIHSHPGGYSEFSEIDDQSDAAFFSAAFSWSETDSVNASLIMLPDGKIFGRVFSRDMQCMPIDRISVAGSLVKMWNHSGEESSHAAGDEFALRTIQAFGEGTYRQLKKLRIGVVGCSGTGSPVIEQLVRLGVGELVLVDPDPIELKNLNRILNSRKTDVGKDKVDVLAAAMEAIDLGTVITVYPKSLFESRKALEDLIGCDLIFGCMDSVDGRNLLSRLTNFYLIPYFDLGVRLIAGEGGSVKTVVGSVHYVQPAKSNLLTRRVYTHERLSAESLRRVDPERYQELVKQKYIEGVEVDRPAVISINMIIASVGVTEFLNRVHPFKDDPASEYARVMIDCCGSCMENTAEHKFEQDADAIRWAGRGLCRPFLRMPELQ
ncbi:MAG: ThiF family adenylyltransferase [Bacteroidetes bacterium]|nr:ThiF family adenylyltransferase [Bacteroidota bacterium]